MHILSQLFVYIYTKIISLHTTCKCMYVRIKKANIMLMVLFVMFVSSLLWLTVAQYVQHLIQISWLFQQYYKAYYYAYGWLELWLAQSKFHGYGFQDGVDNDFIFSDYLACSWSTETCTTNITIKSRWNPIADSYSDFSSCATLESEWGSNHYSYSLWSGDAIIIPMFFDVSTGFDAISYDDIEYAGVGELEDYDPMIYATGAIGAETYLVKVIDEDLVNYNVALSPTVAVSNPYDLRTAIGNANPPDGYDSDPTNKNYLIIANATGDTKEFCIQLNNGSTMVSKYITIDSIWSYRDARASLSAIKVDQLPSFLGYGTINSR